MLKDLTGAGMLLLISAGYYWLAGDINQSALDDDIGARGLPVMYATLLAAIALALALKALITWRASPAKTGGRVNDLRGEGRKLWFAVVMLGIGVGYVAAVGAIGYPIALTLLIGLVALYQGETRGWRLAGIAAAGATVFWIFFDRMLGLDMPSGFWPAMWGG